MSDEVFDILKGLLQWASAIAVALIAWGWKHNEEAHKALAGKADDAMAAALKARQDASDSHSILMDKIVAHVDESVQKAIDYVKEEDGKLHDEANVHRQHITKLFENAEKDRELFRTMLSENKQRSEDRHLELLNAIHQQHSEIYKALSKKVDK